MYCSDDLGAAGELARCREELQVVRAAVAASERRIQTLVADSPLGVALADEQGRFVELNAAMCRVIGRSREELLGRSGAEFVHPDDLTLHAGMEQAQQDSPDGVVRVEARHFHADGNVHWIEMTITATPGPHGEHWTVIYAQDVTARKTAELALERSRAELAAIASMSRSVQLGLDPRPVLLDAVRQLSGASSAAVVEAGGDGSLEVTAHDGPPPSARSRRPAPESVTAATWRSATGYLWSGGEPETLKPHPSDPFTVGPVHTALWQPVVVRDTVLAVLVASWSHPSTEPTEQSLAAVTMLATEAGVSLQAAQLRAELEAQAYTDPMTGSLNRRAWDAALEDLVAESGHAPRSLAIALVDLDHFKAYNDEFGHNAGDALLRDFADNARRCLRATDVFARWGGEEFIIALPDCTPTQARRTLDRVRAAVPEQRTCSVGLTYWTRGEPLTECIARADDALYDAKNRGRNRISVHLHDNRHSGYTAISGHPSTIRVDDDAGSYL